jgi:hypothetical protein
VPHHAAASGQICSECERYAAQGYWHRCLRGRQRYRYVGDCCHGKIVAREVRLEQRHPTLIRMWM